MQSRWRWRPLLPERRILPASPGLAPTTSSGTWRETGVPGCPARPRALADSRREDLKSDGYKPYTRIYAQRPPKADDGDTAGGQISAGFSLWKKRGNVRERYIAMLLDGSDGKLCCRIGWTVKQDSPEANSGEQCRDLTVWIRKDSRNLFKKPLPKAEESTGPERAACLARFKRSRDYKA